MIGFSLDVSLLPMQPIRFSPPFPSLFPSLLLSLFPSPFPPALAFIKLGRHTVYLGTGGSFLSRDKYI